MTTRPTCICIRDENGRWLDITCRVRGHGNRSKPTQAEFDKLCEDNMRLLVENDQMRRKIDRAIAAANPKLLL